MTMTINDNASVFIPVQGVGGGAEENGLRTRDVVDYIPDKVSIKPKPEDNHHLPEGNIAFEYRRYKHTREESGLESLTEDVPMPELLRNMDTDIDLDKLRKYSPYEHAKTGKWAKQMPFFAAGNNYIYVHDYKHRLSEETLKKMIKRIFLFPNMPLNRTISGVKDTHGFGTDYNARSYLRQPGIVNPLIGEDILAKALGNYPYYIGRQEGRGVIFTPNMNNQETQYKFMQVAKGTGCLAGSFDRERSEFHRRKQLRDTYYLSLSPADEDFRPCDATTWYNTSSIGVSVMGRDGISKVVLPNMNNEMAETLLDNDFCASLSFQSSDVVNGKKGLWCIRTIQGGLNTLQDVLITTGLLKDLDDKINKKFGDGFEDDHTNGIRVTIDDIGYSFGSREELMAALDELEPALSVFNSEGLKGHEIVNGAVNFTIPYNNAVVFGLTIAYFISEEELRKCRKGKKALYDDHLDVLINTLYKRENANVNTNRYGTHAPILHPHVYDTFVKKITIRQHNTENVDSLNLSHLARDWHMPSLYSVINGALVSKDTQVLYRRMVVGNEASVVELKSLLDRKGKPRLEGIDNLAEGVYILQNTDEPGGIVQIRLDLNEKEKLSEYGLFHSEEDARAYVVIKETEAETARNKQAELSLDKLVRESKKKETKHKEKEAKQKAKMAEMDHDRKRYEADAKASAEKLSAMSNMIVGVGTLLTGFVGLGTLAIKYMSAKAATGAAVSGLSAAAAGSTATSVGLGLGTLVKAGAVISTAVGAGVAAASSTPLILVGLGLAAVGGLCAWAAGWFD